MTEACLSDETVSMKFTLFGPKNRQQFEPRELEYLDQLQEKYGEVEFKSISQKERCIRITAEIGGLPTPLASIGKTFGEAAERMILIAKGLVAPPPS